MNCWSVAAPEGRGPGLVEPDAPSGLTTHYFQSSPSGKRYDFASVRMHEDNVLDPHAAPSPR